MKIRSTESWDDSFFREFCSIRHSSRPVEQQKSDLFQQLKSWIGIGGLFSFRFCAFIATNEAGALATALVVQSEASVSFLPLGFLEFRHPHADFSDLFRAVEKTTRIQWGDSRPLRGPIQLHFFQEYRWVESLNEAPFYGEPACPNFYHEIMLNNGFRVSERWYSDWFSTSETKKLSQQQRQKRFPNGIPQSLHIRPTGMRTWNRDVARIRELFLESYATMSEFMPISAKAFRGLYQNYKYLVSPRLSYFADLRSVHKEPLSVAFLIGYFDPAPLITRWTNSKLPTWIWKPLLLWSMRRNRHRAILAYVGRSPQHPEAKGAMALLLERAMDQIHEPEYLGIYLAENSPSYRHLPPPLRRHASYVIYQK